MINQSKTSPFGVIRLHSNIFLFPHFNKFIQKLFPSLCFFFSCVANFAVCQFLFMGTKVFAFKKIGQQKMFHSFPPLTPLKSVHLEKFSNNSRRWQQRKKNFLIPINFFIFRRIWISEAPCDFHPLSPLVLFFLASFFHRNRYTALWRGKSFKDRTWAGAKYQNYVKKFTLVIFPADVLLFSFLFHNEMFFKFSVEGEIAHRKYFYFTGSAVKQKLSGKKIYLIWFVLRHDLWLKVSEIDWCEVEIWEL